VSILTLWAAGGGSNFAGIAFPFMGANLRGGEHLKFVAVEPAACPTLTKGKYTYDFGIQRISPSGEDAHSG